MPKWCSAAGCKNHHLLRDENGSNKYSFFMFPSHAKEASRRAQWAKACNRLDPETRQAWKPKRNVKHVYICSAHFISGRPSNNPRHRDYVPTKFDGPQSTKTPSIRKGGKVARKNKSKSSIKTESHDNTEQESNTKQQGDSMTIKAEHSDPYPVSLCTRLAEGIIQLPIKPDPDASSPTPVTDPDTSSPILVKDPPPKPDPDDPCMASTVTADAIMVKEEPGDASAEDTGFIDTTGKWLKDHDVPVRNVQNVRNIHEDSGKPQSTTRKPFFPLSCDICHRKFKLEQHLQYHKELHRDPNSLKCKQCDKAFTRYERLTKHMEVVHNKVFTCPHCKVQYKQLLPFNEHVRTHEAEKSFVCKECDTCFRTPRELLDHISLHSTDPNGQHRKRRYFPRKLYFKRRKLNTSDESKLEEHRSEQKSDGMISGTQPSHAKSVIIPGLNLKGVSAHSLLKPVHGVGNDKNSANVTLLIPVNLGQTASPVGIPCGKQATQQKDSASGTSLLPQESSAIPHKIARADNLNFKCICGAEFNDAPKLQEHFNESHTSELLRSLKVRQTNEQNVPGVVSGKPIAGIVFLGGNASASATVGKPVAVPVGRVLNRGGGSVVSLNLNEAGDCKSKHDIGAKFVKKIDTRTTASKSLLSPVSAIPSSNQREDLPESSILSSAQVVSVSNTGGTPTASDHVGQLDSLSGQKSSSAVVVQNVTTAPKVNSQDSSGVKPLKNANTAIKTLGSNSTHGLNGLTQPDGQSSSPRIRSPSWLASITTSPIKTCGRDDCKCCKPPEPKQPEAEETYVCSVCARVFAKKARLAKHMRCHTGQRDFQCDVCGKRFLNNSYRSIHMRVHTGERPYQCDVCGKSFLVQCNLKKHMRVHTGDKAFECNFCKNRYTDKREQKRHQTRAHEDEMPFACETCGERFSLSTELEEHVHNHHGDKSFPCDMCTKRFPKQSSLHRHQSRVH